MNRALRIELDRFAAADGKRQAAELFAKHSGNIPVATIALAAEAFRIAALRGLRDYAIAGDHESIFAALLDRWQESAAVELKRLARERGAPGT